MPLFPWSKRTPVEEAAPPRADMPSQLDVIRTGFEVGAVDTRDASKAKMLGASRRTDMDLLFQAYMHCPWVSICVDTIARLVTAGGIELVPDDDQCDGQTMPPAVAELERLIRFTNPREDLVQLLRSAVVDLLVFGDSFFEVTELLGAPAALWTLDSSTMVIRQDPHGEVDGYDQILDAQHTASFDPSEVIHVSMDSPRGGLYGVSPTRKNVLAIETWLFIQANLKEIYRRGNPPQIVVDLGQGASDDTFAKFRSQYATRNMGARNVGQPIVTRTLEGAGQPPVKELASRRVQDYMEAADQQRDMIVSGYGMSPAMVGIIESGNIGGGTGESQARSVHYGTVVPIQNIIIEKINYRLLTARGLAGWHFQFKEVDYRDSAVIEAIRQIRVERGGYTINTYRAEIGEPPIDGGDDAVIIDRQNLVLVSDLKAMSTATVASKAGPAAAAPAGVPTPDGQPTTSTGPGDPNNDEPGDPPAETAQQVAALVESYRAQIGSRVRPVQLSTLTRLMDAQADAMRAVAERPVNVNLQLPPPRTVRRTVERDANGDIRAITETDDGEPD